ncbi:MAG TPA: dipicolinate synthase subunit DpsA [Mobilitalea sp.]|nr:dipicolinate synthase subunit DpsA [Mobilitalea sp.]
MSIYDIGIFGGDLRQVYMTLSFLSKGYRVATYNICETIEGKITRVSNSLSLDNIHLQSSSLVTNNNYGTVNTLNELFESCTVLIGPIPLSRDQLTITAKNKVTSDMTIAHIAYLLKKHHILIGGDIPPPLTELCDSKNINYYDLIKDEKIAILNAIATSEGTIMEAIQSSDKNLHGSNCLVLGYGRCAKVLAQKLKALDSHVTITARRREQLAEAEAYGLGTISLSDLKRSLHSFHFIINTIPALILDKECLVLVDPQATLIDISSAPGGIDFNYAKERNLKAKLCLGLPGIVSPKTSSDILVNEIVARIEKFNL